MEEEFSQDWWRWKLYRNLADFVYRPDAASEAELRTLIAEYRRQWKGSEHMPASKEHGYVMDFC